MEDLINQEYQDLLDISTISNNYLPQWDFKHDINYISPRATITKHQTIVVQEYEENKE